MKPFFLLQLRPNTQASDGEFEAFLKFGGLKTEDVHRVRMELEGVPEVNLDDYSGVIVGGGPSNVSDPEHKKSPEQRFFESQLLTLLDEIVEKDFPFFGACYGLGILMKHQGGGVSREKYSEKAGGTTIELTDAGKADPLTEGLPQEFRSFCGHKEACQDIPASATLLATSEHCLVQMIRVKQNIYGVQFHPELDVEGMIVRINVYKNAGYFPPKDAEPLILKCKEEDIIVPPQIMERFVARYRR